MTFCDQFALLTGRCVHRCNSFLVEKVSVNYLAPSAHGKVETGCVLVCIQPTVCVRVCACECKCACVCVCVLQGNGEGGCAKPLMNWVW